MFEKILNSNYSQFDDQTRNLDILGEANLESCFMENEFVYYISADDEDISDESWMIF